MLLSLEKLTRPSGINDIKRVKIKDKEYFIVSFGSNIRIYDDGNEIHNYSIAFNVIHILPYQDCYFLIGKSQYAVYKGFEEISHNPFDREFSGIKEILLIKNSFLIVDTCCRYTIGKIKNLDISLDISLTDSQFYTVIGAINLEDKIAILAKTFNKKYLITYTLENNGLKSTKKEISVGNAIIKLPKDTILFLDREGIWKYQDKPVFIKEFANFKITCFTTDPVNNRTIIFCENGEVISIEKDLNHTVLGVLKSTIYRASMIGNIVLCGSMDCFYVLDIVDRMTVLMKYDKYVDESEERIIFRKIKSKREMFSEHENNIIDPNKKVKLEHDLHMITDLTNSTENTKKCIKRCFRTSMFKAITFESYSILNNRVIDPVLEIHENGWISTTNSILRFTEESIFEYPLQSILSKFQENIGVIYSHRKIYVIYFDASIFKSCVINFDLCDFHIEDDNLYCIDIQENLHIIALKEFNVENVPFSTLNRSQYLDSKPMTDMDFSFFKTLPEKTFERSKGILLTVNGKIFTVLEDCLHKIFDGGDYIYNITSFDESLVISSKNSCIFDTRSKKIIHLNIHSTFSMVYNGVIFLITPDLQIVPFNPSVSYLKCDLNSNIQKYHRIPISLENSIDLKSTIYRYEDKFIEFKNFVQTCFSSIRKNLFCAGLVNVDTKECILVFLKVKNNIIKVRKSLKLQYIPFSICSLDGKVCIVTSNQVLVMQLMFGKIKIINKINCTISSVNGCYFYNKNRIVISSKDWFYLIVNTKKNLVKKISTKGTPIPFIIDKKSGYAIKNIVYWNGVKVDCIEDVSFIFSTGDIALILTKNGSVLQLEVSEKDSSRFIYDSTPTVINKVISNRRG